jgi:ESS family glutamate:Na+ symporter
VYSAAVVFVALIPMILSMNLPAYSVSRGQPILFWLTVIIIGAYAVAAAIAYVTIARKRAFRKPGKLWME